MSGLTLFKNSAILPKSWAKKFEICPLLPANRMDVPAPKAGHFFLERAVELARSASGKTKMGMSEANGHPFCLTPPTSGSAQPIPPSPQIVYLIYLKEPVDVVLTGFLLDGVAAEV